MTTYAGSCLCQAVRFEVNGDFSGFFLCHCSRCRKVTGSAHGANLFSQTAAFTWTQGQEHVKTFRLPGHRFIKSFCMDCGSALPTQTDTRLMVPAGSLDSDVDLRPIAHIFTDSRANWDEQLETVPMRKTFES